MGRKIDPFRLTAADIASVMYDPRPHDEMTRKMVFLAQFAPEAYDGFAKICREMTDKFISQLPDILANALSEHPEILEGVTVSPPDTPASAPPEG